MRLIKRRKKQEAVGPPPGSEGAGIAPTGSPEEPVADDPDELSHLPLAPGPSGNHVAAELGQLRFVAVEQALAVGFLDLDPGLYPDGELHLPSHDAIATGHVEADARRMGAAARHLARIWSKVHTAAAEVVQVRLELDEADRAVVDAHEREAEEAKRAAAAERAAEEGPAPGDLRDAPEQPQPVGEPAATIPPAVRHVLGVVAKYNLAVLAALVMFEGLVSGAALDKALGLDVENLGFVVAVALASVMVLAAEQAGALLMLGRGARALGATMLVLLLTLAIPLGQIRAAEVVDGDPTQWMAVHVAVQALAVLVGVAIVFAQRYGVDEPAEVVLPPTPTLQQLSDARGELVDRLVEAVAGHARALEVAKASVAEAEAFRLEIAASAEHARSSHDHALLVADPALGPFLERTAPTTEVAEPAEDDRSLADSILEKALANFSLPRVYRPPAEISHNVLDALAREPDPSEASTGELVEAPAAVNAPPSDGVPVTTVDGGLPATSTNGHGKAVLP